VMSCESGIQ